MAKKAGQTSGRNTTQVMTSETLNDPRKLLTIADQWLKIMTAFAIRISQRQSLMAIADNKIPDGDGTLFTNFLNKFNLLQQACEVRNIDTTHLYNSWSEIIGCIDLEHRNGSYVANIETLDDLSSKAYATISRLKTRLMNEIAAASDKKQSTKFSEVKSGSISGNNLSIEAKSLALLAEHPDWSDIKIAEAIGCNRTSIYSSKTFKAAKSILKAQRNNFPRGRKNSDGQIEAYDD